MQTRWLLWCCWLAASVVQAADAVPQLLRATEAARSQSYNGVVVYRSTEGMEALRLLHGRIDGIEYERISALSGEVREVIRRDSAVTCLAPGNRVDRRQSPVRGLLGGLGLEEAQRLAAWYEIRQSGTARLAGRGCKLIELAPRDQLRYRYELCSDDLTGVPLRIALTTPRGGLLEEVVFTEISFPQNLRVSDFTAGGPGPEGTTERRAAPPPAEPADIAGFPIALGSIPPGYHIMARERRAGRGGVGTVDHLVLSDGLTAISIFAALGVPNQRAFDGLRQRGGINALGRMVGDFHVTVVGEAPAAAVVNIGEGLRVR